MPRLHEIEAVMAANLKNWLHYKEVHGFESQSVQLYRVIKSAHTEVYGAKAGEEGSELIGEIDCVLIGDDFFEADAHSAGGFKEGWLLTTSNSILVGDRIEVKRIAGGGTRRYSVEDIVQVGTTQAVFRKYRLSSIGD